MNKYLESRALLGCRVTITLLDSNEEKARDAMSRAFLECERIEASYSRFIEGNELAELNAHLNEWVPVGAELLSLIQEGERLKALSEGAFDLTVHSILEGWGYDAQYTLRERNSRPDGAN